MKVLLIVLLSFGLLRGYSQESGNEYKKLIDSAISLKIKNIIEFSRDTVQRNMLLDNVYVIDENELPYLYTAINSGVKLKTIDIKSPESKKILKKRINAWKIVPVLKNNSLTVTIIYFKIYYKNKLCYYVNNGGTQVTFEYSCIDKKWRQIAFRNSRD